MTEKSDGSINPVVGADGFPKRVLVVGAGPAGVAASSELTLRGIEVTLIDRQSLPGGAVESGYSPWSHRDAYLRMMRDIVVGNPLIRFQPNITVGQDLDLDDLQYDGYSAIVIATGSSEDRRLNIPEIYEYLGKGLCTHRQFRIAFNQFTENGTDWAYFPEMLIDPRELLRLKEEYCRDKPANIWKSYLMDMVDGAIIPGGGRGSMEVAKILSVWSVSQKLNMLHGSSIDPIEVSHIGIKNVLRNYGYSSISDIGLKGPTILHWKGIEDMTVFSSSPVREKSARTTNKFVKLIKNECSMSILPWTVAVGFVTSNGLISGIEVMETSRGVREIINTRLVVPSLGNISKPIVELPDNHRDSGVFVVGVADNNVIGSFNSIRRQARSEARQIAEYVLSR